MPCRPSAAVRRRKKNPLRTKFLDLSPRQEKIDHSNAFAVPSGDHIWRMPSRGPDFLIHMWTQFAQAGATDLSIEMELKLNRDKIAENNFVRFFGEKFGYSSVLCEEKYTVIELMNEPRIVIRTASLVVYSNDQIISEIPDRNIRGVFSRPHLTTANERCDFSPILLCVQEMGSRGSRCTDVLESTLTVYASVLTSSAQTVRLFVGALALLAGMCGEWCTLAAAEDHESNVSAFASIPRSTPSLTLLLREIRRPFSLHPNHGFDSVSSPITAADAAPHSPTPLLLPAGTAA
nr:hypothetical protein Iba_chr14bCG4410 [Ipomoea batatas]